LSLGKSSKSSYCLMVDTVSLLRLILGTIKLTPKGARLARDVMRKHRLAGRLLGGLAARVAGHLDDLTAHLVVASGRASDGGGLAATVSGLYVPVGSVEPSGLDDDGEGFSEGVRGLLCGV